jgi:uncharacterized membrane protein HdeD (DUF308 family)
MAEAVPPPPRPIELADLDDRGWLLSVVLGVALVVIGVWLLANLYESVTVLAVLVGISLIVAGLAEAVALGGSAETGGLGVLAWVAGGLLVLTGLLLVAWPDATLWAVAVLAGAGLVVAGAVHAVRALADRGGEADRPERLLELGIGVLGVVVGAIVLAWPDATLLVLAVVLGLRAVATGLVAIGAGWRLHRLTT